MHPTNKSLNCFLFYCTSQPVLGKYQSVLINADNVRYLATYVEDSVTVTQRAISIGTGGGREKVLEIPLAYAGELDPQTTIRITVALKRQDYLCKC